VFTAIAKRPDLLTEAGVLLRLAEYGIRFHDSKLLARAVAEVRPGLMGQPEDDLLLMLSVSVETDERALGDVEDDDRMPAASLSPDNTQSDSGQGSQETSTESGDFGSQASQSEASEEDAFDAGTINQSLTELLQL
jgi:hypothetical protein